jgi:hypothetical protein
MMMRRIVLAVLLACGLSSPVLAQGCGPQNPSCVVPTRPPGDNTSAAASTAFVQQALVGVTGFVTLTFANATYAPLISPHLTGIPTAPTPATNDTSTQIATTAWVRLQGYLQSGPPNVVTTYLADPTGAADSSTAFTNAFAGTCGNTLIVPKGTYKFTSRPADPHCGINIQIDPNAVLDFSAVTGSTTNPVMTFSGTEGGFTALTANGTIGSYTLNMNAVAGFCAPANLLPSAACALRVAANSPTWDPTLTNHPPGEIHLIRSISGNIITLFDPLQDTYTTAATASASPVVLISGMQITGGQFLAPATANTLQGVLIERAYQAKVTGALFKFFGGNGALQWWDDFIATESYVTYVGLGVINQPTANDAYDSLAIDATEWLTVDHDTCYQSGPCFTIGNTSNFGSTRHIWVTNNQCISATAFNEFCFQTHYEGADVNFIGNEVYNDQSDAHITAISCAIPECTVIGNKIYNSGNPILMENGTNRTGATKIEGNLISGATSDCILILPQVASSTGNYTSLTVKNNTSTNCGRYGFFYSPTLTARLTNVDISGNSFDGVSVGGGAFYCIYSVGSWQRFTVSGNICDGLASGSYGIRITDAIYGTIANNNISLDASSGSPIGIYANCSGAGSGAAIVINGNVVRVPGSAGTSFGEFTDAGCLSVLTGVNYYFEANTPLSLNGTNNTLSGMINGPLTTGHCVKSSTVFGTPTLVDGNTAC